MRAEEHAIITVTDPQLLAVPDGAVAGTGVPADAAAVVYDVVLKSFQKAKEKWEMNNQEKVRATVLFCCLLHSVTGDEMLVKA